MGAFGTSLSLAFLYQVIASFTSLEVPSPSSYITPNHIKLETNPFSAAFFCHSKESMILFETPFPSRYIRANNAIALGSSYSAPILAMR